MFWIYILMVYSYHYCQKLVISLLFIVLNTCWLYHSHWNWCLTLYQVLGASVIRWFNTLKEKFDRRTIHCVAGMLMTFLAKLVGLWRKLNNIHPSNQIQSNMNINSSATEAENEEDHLLPCMERLEKLEKAFEELHNKPPEIPLEKERMLVDSLDRIKSVELDLEKTKRVCLTCLKAVFQFCSWHFFLMIMVFYRYYMLPWWRNLRLQTG